MQFMCRVVNHVCKKFSRHFLTSLEQSLTGDFFSLTVRGSKGEK